MATLGDTTVTSLLSLNGITASTFSGNGASLTNLNGSNIASGTVAFARLPTGTGASQVAIGNHTHSYAGSSSVGGAANSVANSLTFSNGGSGDASGTTYNGSAAKTISYNSIGAASSGHDHDGTYLKLAGGTLTGAVTFANGTYNTVGDDSKIGDINVAGTLGLKGANGTTCLAFVNKDNSYYTRLVSTAVTANTDITLPSSAGTLALVGDNNHTHNYAASDHTHSTITGSYTSNGGQQPPTYFGTNKVGALMMNTSVNNNSQYKDWLFMDCYAGNDVGGGVAIGVNRQSLGAYIMRSNATSSGHTASWAESAELLGTHNWSTYCAAKDHNHDSAYAAKDHNHDSAYAAKNHSHTGYAASDHNHDSAYAAKDHTHNSIVDIGNSSKTTTFAYSKSGLAYSEYTWLAGWNGYELRAVNKSQFATADHSHSGYASSSHSHDGTYLNAGPTSSTSGDTYIIGAGTSGSTTYYNTSVKFNGSKIYATSFYATSDRRLKENIINSDLNYLDIINKLQLKEFNFKTQEDKENKYLGLIAQQVASILPEKYKKTIVFGTDNKKENMSINEGKLQYVTMGAVQQLSKKVEKQEKEINKLKQENKELKQLIKEMNKKLNKLIGGK